MSCFIRIIFIIWNFSSTLTEGQFKYYLIIFTFNILTQLSLRNNIFPYILYCLAGTHSSRILPSLPVRIVVAGWCLVAVVLVNAYSCVLTSYLMTPQFHPMIDSVEDIVAIPRPIFMVQRYTSFESLIMVIDFKKLLLWCSA